jgi:COX assembly protein 2
MHPPLDRPHPDCVDVIQTLKVCHLDYFKKFTGGCNDFKVAMDKCLKKEKKRILDELNVDLSENKTKEAELIKEAFGKKETFREYLKKDPDYQRELKKKQGVDEQRESKRKQQAASS